SIKSSGFCHTDPVLCFRHASEELLEKKDPDALALLSCEAERLANTKATTQQEPGLKSECFLGWGHSREQAGRSPGPSGNFSHTHPSATVGQQGDGEDDGAKVLRTRRSDIRMYRVCLIQANFKLATVLQSPRAERASSPHSSNSAQSHKSPFCCFSGTPILETRGCHSMIDRPPFTGAVGRGTDYGCLALKGHCGSKSPSCFTMHPSPQPRRGPLPRGLPSVSKEALWGVPIMGDPSGLGDPWRGRRAGRAGTAAALAQSFARIGNARGLPHSCWEPPRQLDCMSSRLK
ncbi:hypothetical protein KUCAC02_013974, partial [Chaenocephalus aceratus]